MSVLAGLAGSAAGIITIAAAWFVARLGGRAPAGSTWLERGAVLLMFACGSALAVTGALALWVRGGVDGVASGLGGLDSGLPFAVLTVAALFLLAGVVADLIWAPHSALIPAAALPLVLCLTPGGALHALFDGLAVPAGSYASAFASWIGG